MAGNAVRRVTVALVASLGLVLGGTGVAGSAQAAPAQPAISAPNGMVGVQQTVVIYAPSQVNQVVTVVASQGGLASNLQTVIGGSGYGSLFWTPTAAGTWTITGTGAIASATPSTFSVAAVPTTTILEIPNTMQSGTTTNLLVVVNANAGDLAPTGTVTVTTAFGSVVGSAYLTPGSGAESAFALIPYTPTGAGVVPMTASFAPGNPSFGASTSAQAAVNVVTTTPALALRLPGAFNVGSTVFVTAFVTPSNQQGTAAIQVANQGALSGSVALVNGAVTVPWTPVNAGNTTITAQFTNSTATASGVASQPIAVNAALPADVIRVAPTGQGNWGSGSPIPMTVGQNLLMTTSSASGSPVVLSESGPCVINAALLTAVGAGTCTVTATSAGGGSYAATTASYSVQVSTAKRPRR